MVVFERIKAWFERRRVYRSFGAYVDRQVLEQAMNEESPSAISDAFDIKGSSPVSRAREVAMSKGFQYIVDESGETTGVIIDLRQHADLWEDMYDAMIARQRADEPSASLEDVERRLVEMGKLDADRG